MLKCDSWLTRILEHNKMTACLETEDLKVYVDISEYWPKDAAGQPRSVNSVFEEVRGTPDETGRNTMRLALEARLDRGYFTNLVKLANLASKWSGKKVLPGDLLKVEDA